MLREDYSSCSPFYCNQKAQLKKLILYTTYTTRKEDKKSQTHLNLNLVLTAFFIDTSEWEAVVRVFSEQVHVVLVKLGG